CAGPAGVFFRIGAHAGGHRSLLEHLLHVFRTVGFFHRCTAGFQCLLGFLSRELHVDGKCRMNEDKKETGHEADDEAPSSNHETPPPKKPMKAAFYEKTLPFSISRQTVTSCRMASSHRPIRHRPEPSRLLQPATARRSEAETQRRSSTQDT